MNQNTDNLEKYKKDDYSQAKVIIWCQLTAVPRDVTQALHEDFCSLELGRGRMR